MESEVLPGGVAGKWKMSTAEEAGRNEEPNGESALKIYVAGTSTQTGKSFVCLGLLGSLLGLGYSPQDLAYFKPATECEHKTCVVSWCESLGISCQGTGPIVFYSGFTRAFISGKMGTSEELLHDVMLAADKLSKGKRILVIDGVGYPAVGSVCGVSNAAIANCLGAPVLIVGKKGVGDAIDSFNMNAAYFERHGCHVLGCIFNKLPESGYYSIDKCEASVREYFAKHNKANPYGFLPLKEFKLPEEAIELFSSQIDVSRLLYSAASLQGPKCRVPIKSPERRSRAEVEQMAIIEGAVPSCHKSQNVECPANRQNEEVEQTAIIEGAAPSCRRV